MVLKTFYLVGRPGSSTRQLELGDFKALDDLRPGIAAVYNILCSADICFHSGSTPLEKVDDLLDCEAVGIMIAGHPVREPQQPVGILEFGNHFEIYPDNLGNHQRLFNRYGAVIRTDNMGRVTFLTNDPDITALAFREGEYFTKNPSAPDHPLFGI